MNPRMNPKLNPRNPTRPARDGRRGFTLKELMTVVAILSVVASLGSLSLLRRGRSEAATALARELYAQVAAARALALSSSCQVELVLDPQDADGDGAVTTVRIGTTPGAAPAATTETLGRVARRGDARIVALASGVDLSGAAPAGPAGADGLVFAPDGTVRLRSAAPLQLGATLYVATTVGSNGGAARVVVFGASGHARVVLR